MNNYTKQKNPKVAPCVKCMKCWLTPKNMACGMLTGTLVPYCPSSCSWQGTCLKNSNELKWHEKENDSSLRSYWKLTRLWLQTTMHLKWDWPIRWLDRILMVIVMKDIITTDFPVTSRILIVQLFCHQCQNMCRMEISRGQRIEYNALLPL